MRTLAEKIYFEIVGMDSMLDAARTFLAVVMPVQRDDFRCPRFKNMADYIADNVPDKGMAQTIRKWANEVGEESADPSILHFSSPITSFIQILLSQNQMEQAYRTCQRHIDQNSCDADAWWLLSIVLGRQNQTETALLAQSKSLDIFPSGARYAAHASDLNHAGKAPEALETMRRAYALRPWDMRILCELAGHEHANGEYDSAIVHLKEVLKQSDQPFVKAKAHLLMAACLCDGSTECIQSIRAAVELAPHWHFAKLVLGEELIRAGQWREGWDAYRHIEGTWAESPCIGSAPPPVELEIRPPAGPPLWQGDPLAGKRLFVRAWA